MKHIWKFQNIMIIYQTMKQYILHHWKIILIYRVLIIGITFYNENAFDLRRILVSLADQISSFNNIYCQIVLVGDGYKQMAFDTKEYLRQIFCSSENEFDSWNELMSSLDKQCNENSDIIDKTYIFHFYNLAHL